MRMRQRMREALACAVLAAAVAAGPLAAQEAADASSAEAIEAAEPAEPELEERVRRRDAGERWEIPGGSGVLWYDQSRWKPSETDAEDTTVFLYRQGPGQMRLIRRAEPATIDEQIERILSSVRDLAPDVTVRRRKPQLVNGVECTLIELAARPEDNPPILYYGLLYSGEDRHIQLVGVTGMSLMSDFRTDFDLLLDGLAIEPSAPAPSAPSEEAAAP